MRYLGNKRYIDTKKVETISTKQVQKPRTKQGKSGHIMCVWNGVTILDLHDTETASPLDIPHRSKAPTFNLLDELLPLCNGLPGLFHVRIGLI